MLITLSRRAAICQSLAEVQLTGLAPLGAVSHRFNFFLYETRHSAIYGHSKRDEVKLRIGIAQGKFWSLQFILMDKNRKKHKVKYLKALVHGFLQAKFMIIMERRERLSISSLPATASLLLHLLNSLIILSSHLWQMRQKPPL